MAFNEKIFWKNTRAANRAMNKAKNELRELAGRNLQKHTQGYSDELLASLRTATKRQDGEITTIKLGLLRYGIIREVGAGRGWPGGKQQTPNSEKARTPAPWLAETFDHVAPRLADSLAKIKGDDMVMEVDDGFKSAFKDRYRIS